MLDYSIAREDLIHLTAVAEAMEGVKVPLQLSYLVTTDHFTDRLELL